MLLMLAYRLVGQTSRPIRSRVEASTCVHAYTHIYKCTLPCSALCAHICWRVIEQTAMSCIPCSLQSTQNASCPVVVVWSTSLTPSCATDPSSACAIFALSLLHANLCRLCYCTLSQPGCIGSRFVAARLQADPAGGFAKPAASFKTLSARSLLSDLLVTKRTCATRALLPIDNVSFLVTGQ